MQNTSPIEAILWDLDGTLLDSFDIFFDSLSTATSVLELPMPSKEAIAANYHGTLEDSIQAVLQLPNDDMLDVVVDEFLLAQNEAYEIPDDHLYSDAVRLVQRAGSYGLQQFIITNRMHKGRGPASPRHIVKNSTLHDYITSMICGDESDTHKPDASVAWPLLQKYNLDSRTLLVIGDQHVDAELARNLQCQAIIVERNHVSPHLETIPNWQSFATRVANLDSVTLG